MSYERYQELTKKVQDTSFAKLSHAEKQEYSVLKKQFSQVLPETEAVNESKGVPEESVFDEVASGKNPDEEKIILTRAELRQILADEIAALRVQPTNETSLLNGWQKESPEEKRKHTATIKIYRKDSDSLPALIVDWKFHKWALDEFTRRNNVPIYKITLQYDDGKQEVVELPLSIFAEIKEVEKVEILEQKEEKLKMATDFVKRRAVKDGYVMYSPDPMFQPLEPVPLEVKMSKFTCKIKRANGQVLTLPAERLNA
jgi:hypothetical protein